MLKHALPCQWNSIHFSFSTRWSWFNAYLTIVWLNQGMLLQNTLKQTKKKRLSHTEIQTQTGKENYYFTCIDGSSEYIDGFYRNEPCGRQRRRLRLEQSLQLGTCRARNNGRSTDNVRNDYGFDRSNFRFAGHVDRSKFNRIKNEINLRFLLFSFFSCYLSSRCALGNFDMKSWWHATRAVVYNSRIETDIGIHSLPITLSNDSWEINS